MNFEALWEFAVFFIKGSWSTILGWILGLFTSYLATRRHAAMQAETIKTLSDALAAFGEKLKDQLVPLDQSEEVPLARAREIFVVADNEPPGGRVLRRTLKFPPIWLLCTIISALVPIVVASNWPPPSQPPTVIGIAAAVGFVLAFVFGFVFIVSFFVLGDIYRSQKWICIREQLDAAQAQIESLRLNHKQFDHLRRWVSQHAFGTVSRSSVQDRIERAAIAANARNGSPT